MTGLQKILPILLLLTAIGVVVWRMPKVELGHSDAYKRRRLLNWVPLGLCYAFLYFGRYNLSAIVDLLEGKGLMTKAEFGTIDGVGAVTYGVAFLLNGPLADRLGGRITMMLAVGGAALMNAGMGVAVHLSASGSLDREGLSTSLLVLNALNMYFQSFGAVSIVKVNAPWFHVRERGVLGGLFGILISLGLYFAYDWSAALARNYGFVPTFAVPAAILGACFLLAWLWIKDTPSKAGFEDFDTGDATSGQTGSMPLVDVIKMMAAQRVIWIIVAIEFCSGFLRQAVMKWYRLYAKGIGEQGSFVYENWGLLLCCAGILGGVFAGFISDRVFGSRRGPVAAVLYAGMLVGSAVAVGTLGSPILGWMVIFMSLCVIGVHGMLSGTASMDFGGSKNAGVVTGIIDGFVYLGTATQSFLYGAILPVGAAAKDPANWRAWPGAMVPVAIVGLLLATRVWNARPQPRKAAPAPGPMPGADATAPSSAS